MWDMRILVAKILIAAFCVALINPDVIAGNDTLNIKSFGAKGDGKTNDYEAFIKAIDVINNRGGNCTLIVPAGNYLIDAITTVNNKYRDFEFDSCSDLSIIGSAAVINLKGGYNRAADRVAGVKKSFIRSDTYSIIAFSFINCKNIFLSGFEVNGNSDKITRDQRVVEAPSHLLRIWESENVTVTNMYLHHGISDGICIGGKKKFSTNIKVTNVIAESNGRQGMTIVDARDAIFENCAFINTGINNGQYGKHNPGAGVDIEPIRHSINGIKTGNIKFIACRFENNSGGQIRNGNAVSVDSVYFIRDTILTGSSRSRYQLVLGCGYSELNECYIKIANGTFYSSSMRSVQPQHSLIQNSTIYLNNSQIISTKAPSPVAVIQFINNKIYCTAHSTNNWFDFKYGNVKFIKNRVYFPEDYLPAAKNLLIKNEKLNVANQLLKLP
ncbi:glycosyl hydrolase family 28-related protein [Parafilimonas sp.]|uniref:glycosyl hydrolase family 28-related protein n=1 Tax=Parafilimonas sp. TaxID=1969739 RepID=UPI003F813F72